MSEIPRFESGPETEGTIEDKISRVFAGFLEKGEDDSGDFSVDAFKRVLNTIIPGAEVSVVFRDAGSWERVVYFTDKIESNPQQYWKVKVEGANYILPRVMESEPFHFQSNEKVTLVKLGLIGEDNKFIKPLILRNMSGRWEPDLTGIPGILKSEAKGTGDGKGKKIPASVGSDVETGEAVAKVEVSSPGNEIEKKKKEAHGLYIEFLNLLAGVEDGGDLNTSATENGFNDETKDFEGESSWDEYISDLKRRIYDLKKQLEEKRAKMQKTGVSARGSGSAVTAFETAEGAGRGGNSDGSDRKKEEKPQPDKTDKPVPVESDESIPLSELIGDLPPSPEVGGPANMKGRADDKTTGDGALPRTSGEKAKDGKQENTQEDFVFVVNQFSDGERLGYSDEILRSLGREDYWDILKVFIENLVGRTVNNLISKEDERDILIEGITELAIFHNSALFRGSKKIKKLEEWVFFRSQKLNAIKIGSKTFADFTINSNDLSLIFKNAKRALDEAIKKAKEKIVEKENVVRAGDGVVKEGGPSKEKKGDGEPSKENEVSPLPHTPTPVSRPEAPTRTPKPIKHLSPEEVIALAGKLNAPTGGSGLGGGDSGRSGGSSGGGVEKPPVPPVSASREKVEPEERSESEGGEVVELERVEEPRNGGKRHAWLNKALGIALVSGLAVGAWGLLKPGKKGEKEDSGAIPVGSDTNKVEKVEKPPERPPLRSEIVELEKNLTNFVSPDYLKAIRLADRVVSSNSVPEFKGFEQVDPRLADHLAFIWNEDNSFYPKGWVFGKLQSVNYSTNVPPSGGVENYKDGQLNFYTNANFFATFPGNTNQSFTPVGALDMVFAHEIGHANDWTSQNWAYLGRGEVGFSDEEQKLKDDPDYRYEKRLVLLAKVLKRVDSGDRIKFDGVEKLDRSQNALQAEEYWASLCEMYFNNPKELKRHKDDWDLVNDFVQEMDPGFNPEVASMARYQVGRWFENSKDGFVKLNNGGETSLADFRKMVREGLKGYGGKPRKFDAYGIPKK